MSYQLNFLIVPNIDKKIQLANSQFHLPKPVDILCNVGLI